MGTVDLAGGASVTYVVSRWGQPTQTFVRREAEAIAGAGAKVRALSLRPPAPTSAEVPVDWVAPWDVLVGVARAFRRRPGPVLGTLATVVRHSSPRNVVPQLAAALSGVSWYGRGLTATDLLHAHFGWVAATSAWAAGRLSDTPYSVVLHAFELHTRSRLDRFTGVPLRAARAVFTVTQRDVELVRERWGVAATVLRMSAPAPGRAPDRADERDRRWIVSVGSLVPKKGHRDLLRALAILPRPWHVSIAGEGPERRLLEDLVGALDLGGRVELPGHLGELDVDVLLRSAGAFVLASVTAPSGDRDGVPVALMEAMQRGIPVVSTRVGGIPELVEGCGILVDEGDPVELARAIRELEDDERWARAAEAGRARVARDFTPPVVIQPLLGLIRSVARADHLTDAR